MERIVVGADGSDGSRVALEWAVGEALLRNAELDVVHVWHFTPPFAGMGGMVVTPLPPDFGRDDVKTHAQETLDMEFKEAGVAEAGVVASGRLAEGHPAQELLRAAEGAAMLVLGSRGRGGFRDLLLGSVTNHCTHHATSPVVVVPKGHRGHHRSHPQR